MCVSYPHLDKVVGHTQPGNLSKKQLQPMQNRDWRPKRGILVCSEAMLRIAGRVFRVLDTPIPPCYAEFSKAHCDGG